MSAKLWTAAAHVGVWLRINVHMGNNWALALLIQAICPHPSLIRLHRDAGGFTLRRDEHFDVQRWEKRGGGEGRKREGLTIFYVAPYFHSKSLCFALKTSRWSHLQALPREKCECRLEQKLWCWCWGLLFNPSAYPHPRDAVLLTVQNKKVQNAL